MTTPWLRSCRPFVVKTIIVVKAEAHLFGLLGFERGDLRRQARCLVALLVGLGRLELGRELQTSPSQLGNDNSAAAQRTTRCCALYCSTGTSMSYSDNCLRRAQRHVQQRRRRCAHQNAA